MQSADLPLSSLLLDPNNYRIQDEDGYAPISNKKLHLDTTQEAAAKNLKNEGLKELRDSIVSNGFLPIERIVVTPFEIEATDEPGDEPQPAPPKKYLVIEGNRRVAALKQIATEAAQGVDIPQNVLDVLNAVPCVVVEQDGQTEYFKETLMGIRHVGGIRQWGGYQRAKLIADLKDQFKLDSPEVAAKLGLSVQEINRRYRAYRALEQMKENEDFGDLAIPKMYPIFHEAVSLPAVREWLAWNSDTNEFDDSEQTALFYGLISPKYDDETGSYKDAKLTNYSDVRQLKDILPNSEAKHLLLDPDRSFEDAKIIANREKLSSKWRSEISDAISSLKNIGALEVKNLSAGDLKALEDLIDIAQSVRSIHQAVVAQNNA